MNNFLFLLIIIIIAGISGVGMLAPGFFAQIQDLGVFHKDDVTLVGCACVSTTTGLPVTCPAEMLTSPLCPVLISLPPPIPP